MRSNGDHSVGTRVLRIGGVGLWPSEILFHRYPVRQRAFPTGSYPAPGDHSRRSTRSPRELQGGRSIPANTLALELIVSEAIALECEFRSSVRSPRPLFSTVCHRGPPMIIPSRAYAGLLVERSSSARIGTPRLHACTP